MTDYTALLAYLTYKKKNRGRPSSQEEEKEDWKGAPTQPHISPALSPLLGALRHLGE